MNDFFSGHATHPDWRVALSLAGAQIDAQRARAAETNAPLTLGLAYFTDAYAPQAQALVAALKARWPGVAWVGSVGVGVAASNFWQHEADVTLQPGQHVSVFGSSLTYAGAEERQLADHTELVALMLPVPPKQFGLVTGALSVNCAGALTAAGVLAKQPLASFAVTV